MPPLKFFSYPSSVIFTLCAALLFSATLQAVEFEISAMYGQTFSPDIASGDGANSLSTTDEPNIALAFAWQDSPAGQGQILVNYISRDFNDNIDQSTHSFDTLYTHFNGVAFFKEKNYITTVGLGLGATYFNSDFNDEIYPSLTVAFGTRYQFSDNLALVSELRAYATLVDETDTVFCQADSCVAQFDSALWFDSQISVGLAYSF